MPTSDTDTPLVQFDSAGRASVLSYDIPEPTTYTGKSVLGFPYPASYFKEAEKQPPENRLSQVVANLSLDELTQRVERALENGFQDQELFGYLTPPGRPSPMLNVGTSFRRPDVAIPTAVDRTAIEERLRDIPELSDVTEDNPEVLREIIDVIARRRGPISDGGSTSTSGRAGETAPGPGTENYQSVANYLSGIREVHPKTLARALMNGMYPIPSRTLYGDYVFNHVPEPAKPSPTIAIIEEYQLSNHRGDYGAGRTVNATSLFPGESTNISIRTFNNRTEQRQETSNLLESCTRESAMEFEETLQEEKSHKKSVDEQQTDSDMITSSGSNIGGNAGFAGATVGFNAGSNFTGEVGESSKVHAIRERVARDVSNTVDKHVDSTSAKRDVEVNTTSTFTEEAGTEETIEREIENVNLSRTLNLVFRQMNQEFITLYHLVDVRLAYSNGYPRSYREVPLHDIDSLLREVFVETHEGQDVRSRVKNDILDSLRSIWDWKDNLHEDFVTEVTRAETTYQRVNREKSTAYERASGSEIEVPGIILSATSNTLRTDALMVEALLGKGEALDSYSKRLQTESVESRRLENELTKQQIEQMKLARDVVNETDGQRAAEMADRFDKVFSEESKGESDDE